MKKISAAFDGLKFSESTMRYAINIAEESKAILSGVFLDDFLYHSYNVFDVVGRKGIPGEKLEHLLEKDKKIRNESVAYFEAACGKANINYITHRDKSFAILELLKESIYSDLLIIGNSETLAHHEEKPPTAFVRNLLAEAQCPVLIVPATYKKIEKVVLLYDGSPSSVFAIKMLNHMMPWLQGHQTEVVSVSDPKSGRSIPEEGLMREFINSHYTGAKYTILRGDPEEKIIKHLKKIPENMLVVLGAYRRSTVSRWFKTSMADNLMEELDVPLFIAHNKS